jgi:hypothetical protein
MTILINFNLYFYILKYLNYRILFIMFLKNHNLFLYSLLDQQFYFLN